MITGVGIDVVRVERMEHWKDDVKLLERYFHPEEITTALSREKGAAMALAARFAAKEAFGKAIGTGFSNFTLKDIMVINKTSGKPEVVVFGSAKNALENAGANKVHISLTHERDNAIAMIVLEKV